MLQGVDVSTSPKHHSADLPWSRRIAEKYEMGIPIDPQIPRSIGDAVGNLLNDPSLLTRHKRNLRVARDELSWEREETVVRNIISGVLSQHGHG
jgi:hypothetical protein